MTEKQFARWKKMRTKGKWFFILGMTFVNSLFVAVFSFLINYFFNTELTVWQCLPHSLLAGILSSVFFWYMGEAKYREYLVENPSAKISN